MVGHINMQPKIMQKKTFSLKGSFKNGETRENVFGHSTQLSALFPLRCFILIKKRGITEHQ